MTLIAYICSFLPNLALCNKTWLKISWRAAPGQCQCNCSTLHTVTLFHGPETASTDDHHIPALQQKAWPMKSNGETLLRMQFHLHSNEDTLIYTITSSYPLVSLRGRVYTFASLGSKQSVQWTCIGVAVNHAVVGGERIMRSTAAPAVLTLTLLIYILLVQSWTSIYELYCGRNISHLIDQSIGHTCCIQVNNASTVEQALLPLVECRVTTSVIVMQ